MSKIAVIGDADGIRGFAAVGFDCYPCEPDKEAASSLLRKLAAGDYAVLFVTEEVFAAAEDEAERLNGGFSPAVIPVPGSKGNTGAGMARISRAVEKAVGSDIPLNE